MRETITASEGRVLTNGVICGREIYLAEDMDAAAFHEIAEEEYAAMTAEGEPSEDDATEADYQAALGELGVQL